MSRLYPVMRERPPGFRINPASPLYRDLKIAPFDPAIGRWKQEIPVRFQTDPGWWYYRWGSWYAGYAPYVRYHPQWRRHVSFGAPGNSGLRMGALSCLLPSSEFTIAWMESYYANNRFSGAFGVFTSAMSGKLHLYTDSGWPKAVLNGVTLGGHWSHQSIIIRYRPETNGFQFWGNGSLYASGTASLPSWDSTDIIHMWRASNDGTNMGYFGDLMYWTRALTDNEIKAVSDLNNIDYRLGGVPLILPPRRRLWPVVFEGVPTGKVPWHLFQTVAS